MSRKSRPWRATLFAPRVHFFCEAHVRRAPRHRDFHSTMRFLGVGIEILGVASEMVGGSTKSPRKQTESPRKQTESPRKQTESPRKQTESPRKNDRFRSNGNRSPSRR